MITFFPELLKWRHMETDISSKLTFFPELLKWRHMETDISSKQMMTFFPEVLKWRHMGTDISSKQMVTFFPELLKWRHMETDISSKLTVTFFPELLKWRDMGTVATKWWHSFLSYGWNLQQLSSSIFFRENHCHYDDVIMSALASQITSLTIVYSTVYSRRR